MVATYLSLGYLWDNVRVVGGAYGGSARFSPTTGRIMYVSYRDPNLKGTLDIYDRAGDALSKAEISDEDILQVFESVTNSINNKIYSTIIVSISLYSYVSGLVYVGNNWYDR